MKSPRVQPLGLSEKRPQERAQSTTITEAASWDPGRGLIIAGIRLVFVSIRRRFTGRPPRAYGGPATMIMHRVNSRMGHPSILGIGGLPGIMETKDARFPLSVAARRINDFTRRTKRLARPTWM